MARDPSPTLPPSEPLLQLPAHIPLPGEIPNPPSIPSVQPPLPEAPSLPQELPALPSAAQQNILPPDLPSMEPPIPGNPPELADIPHPLPPKLSSIHAPPSLTSIQPPPSLASIPPPPRSTAHSIPPQDIPIPTLSPRSIRIDCKPGLEVETNEYGTVINKAMPVLLKEKQGMKVTATHQSQ